jgi:hypothetical protein
VQNYAAHLNSILTGCYVIVKTEKERGSLILKGRKANPERGNRKGRGIEEERLPLYSSLSSSMELFLRSCFPHHFPVQAVKHGVGGVWQVLHLVQEARSSGLHFTKFLVPIFPFFRKGPSQDYSAQRVLM